MEYAASWAWRRWFGDELVCCAEKEPVSMSRYLSTVLVLLIGCMAANAFAQSALHPLEGTWTVTVTPDDMNGGNHEYQDTWTFSPGDTFTSDVMKQKGFGDGHVDEDSRRFGPSKFTTSIKSDKDGSIKYEGSADGTQINGTITWTKANGDTVTFTFKGEPKR
jgi:hypothetical protein